MPRIGRVVIPDVPYHVTQRGNYRQGVFSEVEDYEAYLDFFERNRKKFGLKVYAWCLMSNHVHFVVEPSELTTLANVFNFTHMRYSSYYNRKMKRAGHLWQGRFFSCPLDSDHFYESIRYVELNPIRAKMVDEVTDYRWSSGFDRLTKTETLPLDTFESYMLIDEWKEYLNGDTNTLLLDSLRKNTKTGRPAGSKKFVKEIEEKTGRSFSLKKAGRPKKNKK